MSTELALSDRAAVALLDDAEKALAEVDTPDDAEELWRKVQAVEEAARLARIADATVVAIARVRLRARRRWGELLPEAMTKREIDALKPGEGEGVPGSERNRRSRARKLAAVPVEVFEAALVAPGPDKPPSEKQVLDIQKRREFEEERGAAAHGQPVQVGDAPSPHWRRPLANGKVEFRFWAPTGSLHGSVPEASVDALQAIFEQECDCKLPSPAWKPLPEYQDHEAA